MDSKLTMMITEIADFEVKNKRILINFEDYSFDIGPSDAFVNYSKPMKNKFVFDKNKTSKIVYHTEYGDIDFDLDVICYELSSNFLKIEYTLSQNKQIQGKYLILLDY